MVTHLIERIMSGEYLGYQELTEIVQSIREQKIGDLQFVSLLAAMETRNRINGINTDECANFLRALRLPCQETLDGVLCNAGTGGDKVKTINVSTTSMPILAAGGVRILKIGYKGVTSRMGSRDLLQAWGIDPFQTIEQVTASVKAIGIGYYDFKNIIVNEKRSGLRSPLHYLGPLAHPMQVTYKLFGCADWNHILIADSILQKVCDNYILTFNRDIDEVSTITETTVIESKQGRRRQYQFDPRFLGLRKTNYHELSTPSDKQEAVRLVERIYEGEKSPRSDLIALNAGFGLFLADKATSIEEGFILAQQILQSGKALEKLGEWKEHQRKSKCNRT